MSRAPLGLEHLLFIGTGAPSIMELPMVLSHLRATFDVELAVCLTDSAGRLVAPAAVAAVTARPVVPSQWASAPEAGPLHVTWAKWADLVVVWPATLSFLARCAAGITNDVATAITLSTEAPVLVAPSISGTAVRRGPYRRVAATLAEDGFHFAGPVRGVAVSDLSESDGGCVPPLALIEHIQRMAAAR